MQHEQGPRFPVDEQLAIRRFSSRAALYDRYRPGYSGKLIGFLREACGLQPAHVVADLGSGTGHLTEPFLNNGNSVFAVEPNAEMRSQAESRFSNRPGFHSIAACAEEVTLPDCSFDVVAAGRSFHWFEVGKALPEIGRVLKPDGWMIVVRLQRLTGTPFSRGFEDLLLEYAREHRMLTRRRTELEALLDAIGLRKQTFEESVGLDLEGLKGMARSFSVSPAPGQPGHESMMEALEALFRMHQDEGRVSLPHHLHIRYGRPRERLLAWSESGGNTVDAD